MVLDHVPEALFDRASQTVSIRLKPGEKTALNRLARRAGVTPSTYAADLLRAGIASHTKGVRRRTATSPIPARSGHSTEAGASRP